MQPIYPFRWDITKRNQLGRLLDTPVADPYTWIEQELAGSPWSEGPRTGQEHYAWLIDELVSSGARSLAFADNADLYFVGRSLESLFDYLSGLLFDTSWAGRPHLLHFSARNYSLDGIAQSNPEAVQEFRRYLAHLALDPPGLSRRERAVAFVDVVASGGTLEQLIGFLYGWCRELGGDWEAVRRKVRIVGLTPRGKTSPKTWRWQQHADWVSCLERGAIKNVSIPGGFFYYLAGAQTKLTQSFPPWRWADATVTLPQYDAPTLMALRRAVALFDAGRTRAHRTRFARELSRQPAMIHPWFRSLPGELNR
jgi:hypothetical protein